MKSFFITTYLLFALLAATSSIAQDCNAVIIKDTNQNANYLLKTVQKTLAAKNNYAYSVEFLTSDQGILARIYSKNGVSLAQKDEFIFLAEDGVRQKYTFIGKGKTSKSNGAEESYNVLQLDVEAIIWLANNPISAFYIKNNDVLQMRKFSLNANQQTELKKLAACFLANLG